MWGNSILLTRPRRKVLGLVVSEKEGSMCARVYRGMVGVIISSSGARGECIFELR